MGSEVGAQPWLDSLLVQVNRNVGCYFGLKGSFYETFTFQVFLATLVLLRLQLWSRESKDPLVLRDCLVGEDQLAPLGVRDFQVR